MTSYYLSEELNNLGFKSIGHNVLISKKTSIYSPKNISIGNNVRIDDFCIISGNITFGNHIHIAAGCLLFGGEAGITMESGSGVSSRCAVYAESDDYSGKFHSNPTYNISLRHITGGGVHLGKYAIIGSGCTILPNVVIGEGVAIGAMSLVNRSLEAWKIYAGIPCKYIKERRKDLLTLDDSIVERT